MPVTTFDEKAQEALRLVLEKYWILRKEQPEWYQLVREHEKILNRYLNEKFGLKLLVHTQLIKLTKIPVDTKEWMGIEAFTEPRDYAIFCCALAFIEDHAADQQFLLSYLCEEIQSLYQGDFPLNWTNYNHRRSLVRVVKTLESLKILTAVEGLIDGFVSNDKNEVLYEPTPYARYFMRTHLQDISTFDSIETLLQSEWEWQKENIRRKRVYRKLFFSPVVYRETEDDLDFAYIRQYYYQLQTDIEAHTPYRLELFQNTAFLVIDHAYQGYTIFPDQRAIMDVILVLAHYLREQLKTYEPNHLGNIVLTEDAFTDIISTLHTKYGSRWSKTWREGTISSLKQEIVTVLTHWEMIEFNQETKIYHIKPALGRVAGEYNTNDKE